MKELKKEKPACLDSIRCNMVVAFCQSETPFMYLIAFRLCFEEAVTGDHDRNMGILNISKHFINNG